LDKQKENIIEEIQALISAKISFGLISESGMPAIADPGAKIVALAHKFGYKVKPLVGPSSIFLALAASGMNGQNFSFNGYLPIKDGELAKSLKDLEKKVMQQKQTQIFIETPYRNNRLVKAILKQLNPQTSLCIAIDITGNQEYITTKTIREWKKKAPVLEKTPTIFLLG